MRRCRLALGLVLGGATAAHAHTVSVTEPRAFGYFIGDRVERGLTIVADPGEQLVASALPQPGPQAYWLDLVDVATKTSSAGGEKTRIDVRLVYQIFYAALEPKQVELPAITLQFKKTSDAVPSAESDTTVKVPALSLLVSPLREIVLNNVASDNADKSPADALRPDVVPTLLPVAALKTRIAILLAVLAATLAALLRHYAIFPFHVRKGRPFAHALKEVSGLVRGTQDTAARRAQMLALHRAFDASLGRRLFAEDIQQFLARHVEHQPSTAQIEAFFAESRRVFFGSDDVNDTSRFDADRLLEFARRLAQEERATA